MLNYRYCIIKMHFLHDSVFTIFIPPFSFSPFYVRHFSVCFCFSPFWLSPFHCSPFSHFAILYFRHFSQTPPEPRKDIPGSGQKDSLTPHSSEIRFRLGPLTTVGSSKFETSMPCDPCRILGSWDSRAILLGSWDPRAILGPLRSSVHSRATEIQKTLTNGVFTLPYWQFLKNWNASFVCPVNFTF